MSREEKKLSQSEQVKVMRWSKTASSYSFIHPSIHPFCHSFSEIFILFACSVLGSILRFLTTSFLSNPLPMIFVILASFLVFFKKSVLWWSLELGFGVPAVNSSYIFNPSTSTLWYVTDFLCSQQAQIGTQSSLFKTAPLTDLLISVNSNFILVIQP